MGQIISIICSYGLLTKSKIFEEKIRINIKQFLAFDRYLPFRRNKEKTFLRTNRSRLKSCNQFWRKGSWHSLLFRVNIKSVQITRPKKYRTNKFGQCLTEIKKYIYKSVVVCNIIVKMHSSDRKIMLNCWLRWRKECIRKSYQIIAFILFVIKISRNCYCK